MKKYNKTIPWISPKKIGLPCFVIAIIINLVAIFLYEYQVYRFQTLAVFFVYISCILYFFSYCIVCHPYACKYVYTDIDIVFKWYRIPYKHLKYKDINCIVISNAVQITAFDSRSFDIPLYYRYTDNNMKQKKQYPYITLLTADHQLYSIKNGMNCRTIKRNIPDSICLGVCFFDSLYELISEVDVDIYVLADVYMRFKEEFDALHKSLADNKMHVVVKTV